MSGDGWGPERRRAALTVALALDGGDGAGGGVSPALPTVLQALAEREVAATFFVSAAVARAEPLALMMIASGGNEAALLADGGEPLSGSERAALELPGGTLRGVRVTGAAAPAAELARQGFSYVQAAGLAGGVTGGVVEFPLDGAANGLGGFTPQAWHEAAQLAVGTAVRDGRHATLGLSPALLERPDALGVFVETLDLIAGLTRAGSTWSPTLADLADWILTASHPAT